SVMMAVSLMTRKAKSAAADQAA
ncbi:hypothetical protein, partial [Bacillus sp. S10C12M]